MRKTEVMIDYLYELYEIHRNVKTRKSLQQIQKKKPENLAEYSNHLSLQSAFRYRTSHDPGCYQYVLSEVFHDNQILQNVKTEILELFSSPLLDDEINPFIGEKNEDLSLSDIPHKYYYQNSSENQVAPMWEKALIPTNQFLQYCFEKAEKQGLNDFLIPIQTLIFKYSFNEGTDYLLYPTEVHFSELQNDGYEKAKSLKSKWGSRQLNYSWKKLRFFARYLKEEKGSEGSRFLYFYNIAYLEFPEFFIDFCKELYGIITDQKIIENHTSLENYSKNFQRFVRYTFEITNDKWYERKEIEDKISLLNTHYKFLLTDEIIQNYYQNSDEWKIFCEAQSLLKDNFLLESCRLFEYLNRNAQDPVIKKISSVSSLAIEVIFRYDDPVFVEKFITQSKTIIQDISGCEEVYYRANLSLVYPYIQNSVSELNGIFRFNSLCLKKPFTIRELSELGKTRSFKDFSAYVNYQKKCFQFDTAGYLFSVSSRRGCIACQRFIGEMNYYLGKTSDALRIFQDIIENPKSNFLERFQSTMILGIIQFNDDKSHDGIETLKSIIQTAKTENKINNGLIYNFFRMTVRGLLPIYSEEELTKICEQFSIEFQSCNQKRTIVYAGLCNALFDHECYEECRKIISLIQNDEEKEVPDANLILLLGKINSYQGRFIEAIRCYNKSLKSIGPEPVIYRQIAFNHAALNEYSLARDAIEKAKRLDPANEEYENLRKTYAALSETEGVYLNRISDPEIYSMFFTAESEYFSDDPHQLKNYGTIFNQYGGGVEVMFKRNIIRPMRKHLLEKLSSLPTDKRTRALKELHDNHHLWWLENVINNDTDQCELGKWKGIAGDIRCNKNNPIILEMDRFLRSYFNTKNEDMPIPKKILDAINFVRADRNPADHGEHFTFKQAMAKKKKIVQSVNTLILFFEEQRTMNSNFVSCQ